MEPETVAALGTSAAAIIALVIAVYEQGARRRERERDQANRVAAWTERSVIHYEGWDSIEGPVTLYVRNTSELPIHDVSHAGIFR